MILVLLPGLDGTGLLFKPFLASLPLSIKTQVIPYPTDQLLTYEALATYVSSQLPTEDFVLLAESFSGPIAFLLAQQEPKNLKSIIFVASFLSAPRLGLQKIAQRIPLFSLPLPKLVIKRILLGKKIDSSMITLFKRAVKQVPAKTMKHRLNQITTLALEGRIEEIPCSYIQAMDDKLVLADSVKKMKQRVTHMNVLQLSGPHFIMQAQAVECANFVSSEIASRIRSSK